MRTSLGHPAILISNSMGGKCIEQAWGKGSEGQLLKALIGTKGLGEHDFGRESAKAFPNTKLLHVVGFFEREKWSNGSRTEFLEELIGTNRPGRA